MSWAARSLALQHDLDVASTGGIGWQFFLQKAGTAQDGGEEVIEIVSDTAGEHAQAFQFLGVAGAFFEALAFRNVAEIDGEAARLCGIDTFFPPGIAFLGGTFRSLRATWCQQPAGSGARLLGQPLPGIRSQKFLPSNSIFGRPKIRSAGAVDIRNRRPIEGNEAIGNAFQDVAKACFGIVSLLAQLTERFSSSLRGRSAAPAGGRFAGW